MLQRARLLALVMIVAILAAFAVLGVRLFCLQIMGCDVHFARAEARQTAREYVPKARGSIADCQGRILCTSVACLDVYADCDQLENKATRIRSEKDETIEILGGLLGLDRGLLRSRIDCRLAGNLAVARRLTDRAIIDRLYAYKDGRLLRGVQLEKSFARAYPQGRLLGHVLGHVNADGIGVAGVEALADSFLRGERGLRLYRHDGVCNEIFCENASSRPGYRGGDIELTVDATIQLFAETELERIEREYTPGWAAMIVLEPATGRILAAASVPAFDPADPASGAPGRWTNHVFQAEYNPGSSFKPLMMAIVMDEGKVDPAERIDCENGRWRVGGRTVTDVHGGYGLLSPEEILVHSSNIGIAKLALRLVPEDAPRGSAAFGPILTRLELMGLGRKPGVLRPEEEDEGILTGLRLWTRVYTLVSVAFGYEMTVTPIQMAAAFATLANRGMYVPPRLVEAYIDAEGRRIDAGAGASCRVFSAESAAQVTGMLERAVQEGTGKPARIEGCAVAGKTGTARKDNNPGAHTGSFVAFAPAEDPALLVLVVVDEPRGAMYGGTVAAPAVKSVLEKGLAYRRTRSKDLVLAEIPGGADACR